MQKACKTGQRPVPGSWGLSGGIESDSGLEEMPEVLPLPKSSGNGEKSAAWEQQSLRNLCGGMESLRNLCGEMEPMIRSFSLQLCKQGAPCYVLLSPQGKKKEFL